MATNVPVLGTLSYGGDHVPNVQRDARQQSACLSTLGRGEVERETGFEPATFCLGSRHSAS